MSDIINFQDYVDKKKEHKLETSVLMSQVVDAMENIVNQCKEGLLDIPEAVNHLEFALSSMPPGSIDLEAEPGDRPFYLSESKRPTASFSAELIVKMAILANTLDQRHLYNEADILDEILNKIRS